MDKLTSKMCRIIMMMLVNKDKACSRDVVINGG
jgi:hypothetical protein